MNAIWVLELQLLHAYRSKNQCFCSSYFYAHVTDSDIETDEDGVGNLEHTQLITVVGHL